MGNLKARVSFGNQCMLELRSIQLYILAKLKGEWRKWIMSRS